MLILFIIFISAVILGFGIAALFTFFKCRIEGKKAMKVLAATKQEIDALFHET